ncbi:DNA-binding transcriptional LysR family regulator [Neorhizobium huautlense]|uniref:DNA-binding transcriptional LysR family regulator n=1 Tax=Neorhizobium huautlense TaxID=67774 RepID=A0ABT9Q0V1_9HYPH|nr:LysR family transcriptional regulator [Neorhizobium huautlense]MDP9840361.1 DNA-binding transcriptional LysR family regulator [Neorhizobium huautlense]
MLPPRRFFPSFSLLIAFEAAARTSSVTAAARELGLTQSAVSRQIAALEGQLGAALFLRERQTIRLTLAGDTYAREVREALRRISSASLNLRANPSGGTLNLAVLPFFGTRWLTPRIGRFSEKHPGMMVNLITRLEPFDFRFDTLDAAIHFGEPRWPGADLTFLLQEDVIPVCSPDFKLRRALTGPADVLRAPLLHLNTRPDAWETWFASRATPFDALHGMLFDQFAPMVEAAVAGLGAALLPRFLIGRELDQGLLVPAIENGGVETGGYHLACPPDRVSYPPLAAFRAWLLEEVAADTKIRDRLRTEA